MTKNERDPDEAISRVIDILESGADFALLGDNDIAMCAMWARDAREMIRAGQAAWRDLKAATRPGVDPARLSVAERAWIAWERDVLESGALDAARRDEGG